MLFCMVSFADLLDRKQKEMISRETGCDCHSIKCPEDDIYRTITGECNNRYDLCVGKEFPVYALTWLEVLKSFEYLSKGREE